jgi:YHS domain-containing protein
VSSVNNAPLADIGSQVVTACKGVTQFEQATPNTVYRGQRIYFCLQSCLETFKVDPKNSCLVGDPLVEES